jgi:hypothetical protein
MNINFRRLSVACIFGIFYGAIFSWFAISTYAVVDENSPADCVTPNCGDCTVQQLADGSCVAYQMPGSAAFTFKTCKYNKNASPKSPCIQTSTKNSMACGAPTPGKYWYCNSDSNGSCDFGSCNCGSTNPTDVNATQDYYTCN